MARPSDQALVASPSNPQAVSTEGFDPSRIAELEAALAPFAVMGRVMETRAMVTFGKMPKDGEIVCQSSGEAGHGILTMGHFRDAAALLPKAPGWGGMYRPPFDRAALANQEQSK